MRKLRLVISIDGGGIRGLIPLRILNFLDERIQLKIGKSVNQRIDLVAGTSTGAIISAALIVKKDAGLPYYTTSGVIDLYRSRGHQIFSKDRTNNKSPLQLVLDSGFGQATMKSLTKQFAFVCYDEHLQDAFVFHNELKMYRDVPLSKLLLASCAIPPYFKPVQIGGKVLSDGILAAKNPSEVALNLARCYFPNDVIVLLSLGTGVFSAADSVELEVNRVHESILEQSKACDDLIYYRLNPPLVNATEAMDNTSPENMEHLLSDAQKYLDENVSLMNTILNSIDS